MNRAVFIGGLNNGKRNINKVADTIGVTCNYEVVERFTFAQAMQDPDMISEAVRGVDTFTHSAGMLALVGARPACIEAFNPPVQRSITSLFGRTALKMVRMHTPGIGFSNFEGFRAVGQYDLSTAAEMTANLGGNLRHLPAISRFSAVAGAIDAKYNGIDVRVHTTNDDEYFTLTPFQRLELQRNYIWVTDQPGVHDELVLRPATTLRRAFDFDS